MNRRNLLTGIAALPLLALPSGEPASAEEAEFPFHLNVSGDDFSVLQEAIQLHARTCKFFGDFAEQAGNQGWADIYHRQAKMLDALDEQLFAQLLPFGA